MDPFTRVSNPVLLVDDEAETLNSYTMVLRSGGIDNTLRCQDSREVLPLLASLEIEVILLDLTMPFVSGEELLSVIAVDFPEIPVIVATGNNDIETAVQCMKSKAFDYMVKPIEKSRL
ncbi:MAG: response regulator, partial [Nitrospirota bacterium]